MAGVRGKTGGGVKRVKPSPAAAPKAAETRAAPAVEPEPVVEAPAPVAAKPAVRRPRTPRAARPAPVAAAPAAVEPAPAAAEPVIAEAIEPVLPAVESLPEPAAEAAASIPEPAEAGEVVEAVAEVAEAVSKELTAVPATAADPLPVATPPAETANSTQGTKIMTTITDSAKAATAQVTEKFESLLGEANARAKTAVEKGTKLVEELSDLTKGNVEALVASGRIAAKGAETIGQGAADYGRKSFESATAAFKSFASAKSPTELFQLQSEYAKSAFDASVAEASKFSETYVKLLGEIFEPISSRAAVAAEKVKSVAL